MKIYQYIYIPTESYLPLIASISSKRIIRFSEIFLLVTIEVAISSPIASHLYIILRIYIYVLIYIYIYAIILYAHIKSNKPIPCTVKAWFAIGSHIQKQLCVTSEVVHFWRESTWRCEIMDKHLRHGIQMGGIG